MARHGGETDPASAGLGRAVGPQVPSHSPSRSLVRPSPGLYTAWVAAALAITAFRSGNATTPVDTPTTPVTSQPTTEPAPAIEQFARDNSDRLTVVGVGGAGTLEIAQDFVVSKSTTFATLWSESREAWDHYGMDSASDFMRLDPFGNRLAEPGPFDEHLEQLVDDLV